MARKKYSERLGTISDDQLQQALDRHGLGRLISAEPMKYGLFGQNIFVTTDKGEYVLRGKPHYDWQFPTEQFFATQLHKHTKVPVPFPYMYDPDATIFGWEYVLMPKLPGFTLKDNLSDEGLTDYDRIEIARIQGAVLAEAQKLTWNTIGKYNLTIKTVEPSHHSYAEWMEVYIEDKLEKAQSYNDFTTKDDIRWVKDFLKVKRKAMEKPFVPTFVMQDYKPGNMNFQKINSCWKMSGLFDLMECYFGNGESDLARMFCVYIGSSRKDLAYTFIKSYIRNSKHKDVDGLIARFPVYILRDRTIIWEWKQRPEKQVFENGVSFRTWVTPCLELDKSLLCN